MKGQKQKKRRTAGTIPWGYRLAADGISLEPDERERNTAFVARHMAANGYTPSMIAALLADLGVANRNGKPFDRSRVFEILEGGRKRPRRRRASR